MFPRAAIILAAGQGVRMKSDIPKVLHEIRGKPMLRYVIESIRPFCAGRIYVVVGYKAELVIEAFKSEGVRFVRQEEQMGTGHAVMQCEGALRDFEGTVVVLNGDVPALREETIRNFFEYHDREGASATVLTAVMDDPAGYGRIVRDGSGGLERIVEERDGTREERKIREINSGLFCFEKSELFDALNETDRKNDQNEYYLTDVIGLLKRKGRKVAAFRTMEPKEVAGINTLEELNKVGNFIKGP